MASVSEGGSSQKKVKKFKTGTGRVSSLWESHGYIKPSEGQGNQDLYFKVEWIKKEQSIRSGSFVKFSWEKAEPGMKNPSAWDIESDPEPRRVLPVQPPGAAAAAAMTPVRVEAIERAVRETLRSGDAVTPAHVMRLACAGGCTESEVKAAKTYRDLQERTKELETYTTAYFANRVVATLHDFEAALVAEYERPFVELGLGPLLKQPFVARVFKLSSALLSAPALTAAEVVVFLNTYRRDKWKTRINIAEFMAALGLHLKKRPEELGVTFGGGFPVVLITMLSEVGKQEKVAREQLKKRLEKELRDEVEVWGDKQADALTTDLPEPVVAFLTKYRARVRLHYDH